MSAAGSSPLHMESAVPATGSSPRAPMLVVSAELALKDSSSFVQQCAGRLLNSSQLRRDVKNKARRVKLQLDAVVAAPNQPILWWAVAVELAETGRSLEAIMEDGTAWSVNAVLAAQLRRSRLRPARARRLTYTLIIASPALQSLILSVALLWASVSRPADQPNLCGPVWHRVEDDFGGNVEYWLPTLSGAGFFALSSVQIYLGSIEWEAIELLTSLRFDAAANLLIFIAAVMEQVNKVLFCILLYLLLKLEPGIIAGLLNCVGLNFVMDLDHLLAPLSPLARRSAAKLLGKLREPVTDDDVVLFLASSPDHWASCGLHRLPHARSRRLCTGLLATLKWAFPIFLALSTLTLTSCVNLETTRSGDGTTFFMGIEMGRFQNYSKATFGRST